MTLRRGLRNWLLAKDSDPSVRLRVLRDLLERPADDPAVVGAQREIGRKGWAAQILRGQHPSGQWVNAGSSAFELYRPKYVATNWRLLVLSDLGLTKKTPRVAKAARLFLDRFSRSGDLGGRSSEVCIAGNSVRMMARFGYQKDPRVKAAIEWLVRHQKRDGGWHCFRSSTGTLDCWEALANPRIDRAGRGILSGPTAVPRGARSLPSLVPATLSRTLLLRHSGRTRHPHIPRVWQGPADATRPRPPRSDAQPGRKLEHGCPSPGQRGPGVPVSRAVLPPRPRGPGPAKPMDHDDRALGPETGGPLTRPGPRSHRRNRGWTAAGRARTGDFEIFSLALSQTELPRREASERPAKEIVFGRASMDRVRGASP